MTESSPDLLLFDNYPYDSRIAFFGRRAEEAGWIVQPLRLAKPPKGSRWANDESEEILSREPVKDVDVLVSLAGADFTRKDRHPDDPAERVIEQARKFGKPVILAYVHAELLREAENRLGENNFVIPHFPFTEIAAGIIRALETIRNQSIDG